MRRSRRTPRRPTSILVALVCLALPTGCVIEAESNRGAASAASSETDGRFDLATVDAWVELWATYDLDRLDELFLTDDRVTYYSSETEGLIRGFDAIVEHHRGFGFVPGGMEPEQELWVEDIHATDLGETVVVGAIWYFGDREAADEAQRGPMTVVYERGSVGYRIAHMHFGNYDG